MTLKYDTVTNAVSHTAQHADVVKQSKLCESNTLSINER